MYVGRYPASSKLKAGSDHQRSNVYDRKTSRSSPLRWNPASRRVNFLVTNTALSKPGRSSD